MPISVSPKAVTNLKKVLYSPQTIVKYFEKGQPHACNYCMHKTAKICPDTHPFVTRRVQTMPLEILEKASPVKILWNYATPLGNSKTKNQDPWIFLNHPWKLHFPFNWPLEFPHVISSIPLENPSLHSTCLFWFF